MSTTRVRRAAIAARLLLALFPVLAACATGGARAPARSASAVAPPAPAPFGPLTDAVYAPRLADSLRAALLARAGWAAEGDPCDPGALRAFPEDTTRERRAATAALIERLETLVASYGLETPLDAPPTRDLLQTIVSWEAGGTRPRWDVKDGEPAERRAVAPGLGGRYRSAASGKCESYVRGDTVTIVLPLGSELGAPRVRGVRVGLMLGDSALRRARAAYFARDTSAKATFEYAHVAPVLVWGEYALATVRRLGERRDGALTMARNAGNASYVFHSAGGEWRLLAIARSW